jgi:hypothetical protein
MLVTTASRIVLRISRYGHYLDTRMNDFGGFVYVIIMACDEQSGYVEVTTSTSERFCFEDELRNVDLLQERVLTYCCAINKNRHSSEIVALSRVVCCWLVPHWLA